MSNALFGLAWRLMRWIGKHSAIVWIAGASVTAVTASVATGGALTEGAPSKNGDGLGRQIVSSRTADEQLALKRAHESQQLSLCGTLFPLIGGGVLFTASFGSGTATLAAAGLGIGVPGLIVGPSLGYFHGGCPARARTGILIRGSIGLAALVGGLVVASTQTDWDKIYAAAAVFGGGLAAMTLASIYDIAAVKGTVERHYLSEASNSQIKVAPALMADGKAPGIAVRLTFR